jgi:hypothetical protein
MSADPLKRIACLYHFTDRRNVPLIRERGGLYPMSELRRRKVEVPAPGGNQWSRDADVGKGMDDYVHLCFRPRHPMEYLARKDGRIQNSIFLKIDPSVMYWDGVRFTADVSNKRGIEVHTMDEARKVIDFEVLCTRMNWSNPEVKKRLRRAEKCEILVPTEITLDLIRNLRDG